jgi:HNH endonuclease
VLSPEERLERGSWGSNGRGCRLWKRSATRDGYGYFYLDGKATLAHRASWILNKGSIPVGMKVLHHCDMPACTNHRHLFLGTDLDNARDRDSKGRRRPPVGAHNGRAKLCDRTVAEIRKKFTPGKGTAALAREYGVSPLTVQRIGYGKAWA